jgi:hypothetical protein
MIGDDMFHGEHDHIRVLKSILEILKSNKYSYGLLAILSG